VLTLSAAETLSTMPAADVVAWSLRHFYHLDHANACMHHAPVRFSPLTFRLAELFNDMPIDKLKHPQAMWCSEHVLKHKGAYTEDTGR
jgi:hypothetical protein